VNETSGRKKIFPELKYIQAKALVAEKGIWGKIRKKLEKLQLRPEG